MKTNQPMGKAAALLLAGLLASGLAQAQSHSVANYSNPPNAQADSKAGTDATPGQSASADQQDAKHAGKGAKDAAANKGKSGKSASKAKQGAGQRSAKKTASQGASEGSSAPVSQDGASKGGAQATMQYEPSQKENDPAQTHAFDNGAAKK